MWTDVRSSLEVELSRHADLFIQFINSTVSASVDTAAHKTSTKVLVWLQCQWEVECREGEESGG